MKPVFVTDRGGRLYQTGYKQLSGMPVTKREFLMRDVTMAIAVSPHAVEKLAPITVHLPFGDNKQWTGPNEDLAGIIEAAAALLVDGKNVAVYCYYGRNRSGLVCALIIREALRVPGHVALATLRQLRKGAVGGNEHFVSYLNGLEAP